MIGIASLNRLSSLCFAKVISSIISCITDASWLTRVLGMVFFYLLTMPMVQAQDSPDTVNRINYGVVFHNRGVLHYGEQSWLHSFVINLPKIPKESDMSLDICVDRHDVAFHSKGKSNSCKIIQPIIRAINEVRLDTMEYVKDLNDQMLTMLPHTPLTGVIRSRRSLLPFIGDWSSSLFGTATVRQVKTLQAHIIQIANQTNKITHAFQTQTHQMTSFMSATTAELNQAVKEIKLNHRTINIALKAYKQALNETDSLHTRLQLLSIDNLNHYFTLRSKATELFHAISQLFLHKMTPQLISPTLLSNTLSQIQLELKSEHPTFKIANFHPNYYYESAVQFSRHNDQIIVVLPIPVTQNMHIFNLYQVVTFPIPINSTSPDATELDDRPYLAVSKEYEITIELTHDQFALCKNHGQFLYTCPILAAIQNKPQKSCLSAIYFGHKEGITEQCRFHYVVQGARPNVYTLGQGQILLMDIKQIVSKCPEQKHVMKGCKLCIIQPKCDCELIADNYYIQPQISDCVTSGKAVTMVYPVNMALLQLYFSKKQLEHFAHDMVTEVPLNYTLPAFQLFQHNFSQLVAQEKHQRLSLSKMVQRAKQNQVIYDNLAQPILGEPWINLDDKGSLWPFVSNILTYVSIFLSICGIVAVAIMFCKVKRLMVLVGLLQGAHSIRIEPTYPTLVWRDTQSTQNSEHIPDLTLMTEEFVADNYLVIIVLLVLPLLIILIVSFIRCTRSFTKKNHTVVQLCLSNGQQCAAIQLMVLPLCPENYYIQLGIIRDVKLSGILGNQVEINWKTKPLIRHGQNGAIQVPNNFKVGIMVARKMRKIMKANYNSSIMIIHDGMYHQVTDVQETMSTGLAIIPNAPPEMKVDDSISNENSPLVQAKSIYPVEVIAKLTT